jgi:tetratricopeptide (TPR) repeat protein
MKLLLPLMCLILAGCASAPAPAPVSNLRQQARQADQAGREEYQRGRYDSADRHLERAAKIYSALDDSPALADARHNQAQALLQAGNVEAARQGFESALALNRALNRKPEQAGNLAGLARCFVAQSNVDRAIELLEESLTLAVLPVAQNDLAMALLDRGRDEDRARDVAGAAAGRLNLGRAQLRWGERAAAQTSLEKSLELFRAVDDPAGLARAHELLAELCRLTGDVERAIQHEQSAREKWQFLSGQ